MDCVQSIGELTMPVTIGARFNGEGGSLPTVLWNLKLIKACRVFTTSDVI